MYPSTCGAGYSVISFMLAFGRIVGDPALHLQPCVGAAVNERGHRAEQ